jgi:hypothetical protein
MTESEYNKKINIFWKVLSIVLLILIVAFAAVYLFGIIKINIGNNYADTNYLNKSEINNLITNSCSLGCLQSAQFYLNNQDAETQYQYCLSSCVSLGTNVSSQFK